MDVPSPEPRWVSHRPNPVGVPSPEPGIVSGVDVPESPEAGSPAANDEPASWFADRLLAWFDRDGRHDLPWQLDKTPYRVWVSEVMLQQTQVATVVPYFERFMRRFPDLAALARADLDEVLHCWTGLGYYARARNLHAAARRLLATAAGDAPDTLPRFPDTREGLLALPGIGRSTAGAVLAIAFGQPSPILDANVKRVLARFHGVAGHPGERDTEQALWSCAEAHTPAQRPGDYAQAIMDFGATHCRRVAPACGNCPVSERCQAFVHDMQDHWPTPATRRERPARAVRMFLLVDPEGACLLERRPAEGIWGGLWSVPERSMDIDADAFAREWGVAVARHSAPPPFRHSFTHYHLDVTPHYLWVRHRPEPAAGERPLAWYRPGDGREIGLSAVARRLLAGLDGGFELSHPAAARRPTSGR